MCVCVCVCVCVSVCVCVCVCGEESWILHLYHNFFHLKKILDGCMCVQKDRVISDRTGSPK